MSQAILRYFNLDLPPGVNLFETDFNVVSQYSEETNKKVLTLQCIAIPAMICAMAAMRRVPPRLLALGFGCYRFGCEFQNFYTLKQAKKIDPTTTITEGQLNESIVKVCVTAIAVIAALAVPFGGLIVASGWELLGSVREYIKFENKDISTFFLKTTDIVHKAFYFTFCWTRRSDLIAATLCTKIFFDMQKAYIRFHSSQIPEEKIAQSVFADVFTISLSNAGLYKGLRIVSQN